MPDDLVMRIAGATDIVAVAKLRLAWGDGAHAEEHPDFERDLAIEAAEQREYVRIVLAPTVRSVPFYRRAGFVDAGGAEDERLLMRPSRLA
jgi:hypothetical protein